MVRLCQAGPGRKSQEGGCSPLLQVNHLVVVTCCFQQTAPSRGWLSRLRSGMLCCSSGEPSRCVYVVVSSDCAKRRLAGKATKRAGWSALSGEPVLERPLCCLHPRGLVRLWCCASWGVRIGLCPIKAIRGMDCSSSGSPFLPCTTCKSDQAQSVPFEACIVPLVDAVLADLDCAEGSSV